jgi:hypothetical protein
MSDENTKIDNEAAQEALDGLVAETDRIVNDLLRAADVHAPVKMTEAELWASLIPPFED